MSTSETELREAVAQTVSLDDKALKVGLTDGRVLVVPLSWFPRLAFGTSAERSNWSLIGRGEGIHWPDLDEDISIESLLAGRRSGETMESLRRWRYERSAHRGKFESRSSDANPITKIGALAMGYASSPPELFLAEGLLGFVFTAQPKGESLTYPVPGPSGAYVTAIPQPSPASGCIFGQAVDLLARIPFLDLYTYTNPLPDPASREWFSSRRTPRRDARKKRSSGSAKRVAA
jgi:hypothetical protein